MATGVSALGFALASSTFSGSPVEDTFDPVLAHPTEVATGPASELLGAKSIAPAGDGSQGDWVQVVDAVKMRQGPSSTHAVVAVQRSGKRLRVLSRDGRWIEVVELASGRRGWVYGKYVERVESGSQHAEVPTTRVR